jgi:hypothetical protein
MRGVTWLFRISNRLRSKVAARRKYLIVFVVLIDGNSIAQKVDLPKGQSYSHGTCVIVARRGRDIAVAADSRTVSPIAQISPLSTQSWSVGPDECKLRRPSPEIMLGIEGLGRITNHDNGAVKWDALDAANNIFATVEQIPSVDELLSKAKIWQDSFQEYVNNGKVRVQRLEDGGLPALHVLTSIDGRSVVITAKFKLESGQIDRIPAYPVNSPDNVISVYKYGSCAAYLADKSSRMNLTKKEKNRYEHLKTVSEPAATSESQLRKLALDYVRLAADISMSLATPKEPADVAPPFTSSSFDFGSGRWKNHQSGACRDYLGPEMTSNPKIKAHH